MALDPIFAAVAAPLESYEADWVSGDPDELRRLYVEARASVTADIHPDCAITPFACHDGPDGLVFAPNAGRRTDTAILYFHGGSWLVGSPETHRSLCSHLAVATGMRLYSIRYGLAPEHRFPSQRDEGLRALQALLIGAVDADPRPDRLVLAGDSAGAAICFWMDHALDDANRSRIAGIAALYGAYGLMESNSLKAHGEPHRGLAHDALHAAYARLGDLDALFATPGFAIAETARTDGPPCYLSAAGLDPVLDDSIALHERLRSGGRASVLDIAETLPHSHFHYVARVPAVQAALTRVADWIVSVAE